MRATRTVGIAVVALGVTMVLGACAPDAAYPGFASGNRSTQAPTAPPSLADSQAPTAEAPAPAPEPPTAEAPAPQPAPAPGPPPAPAPPAAAQPAPAPPATTFAVDGTALPPDPALVTGQVPAVLSDGTVLDAGPYVYGAVGEAAADRQLAYLMRHWNSYNPRYGDFNAWGGDCQNFVSQSLVARGWTMTAEWYNDWPNNSWSAAWVHVPSFNNWLAHNPHGATTLGFGQKASVKVGDLVVFDWDSDGSLDHIQVVSRVSVIDGQVKVAMAGHNNDSDYRDLDQTITVDHPGASGWFWSIP